MFRWMMRLNALFVVLPAGCLLCFSLLFTTLPLLAVPQLPAWARGPVTAWVMGGPAGVAFGSPPSAEIPPGGYTGPESFQCLLPPEIGDLTDSFGVLRQDGWVHKGIDYGTHGQHVPVRTPFGGQVVFAGWGGAYGNLVIIENDGHRVYLAHLESFFVGAGVVLTAGDPVGLSGSTGNSSGIHVHFEIRVWNGSTWTAVDPNIVLLPGQVIPCPWESLAKGAG